MDFKKLGLGLALTASFGLMACGDDSSSSPDTTGSVLDNSCKVSVSGKTASYTRVSQGIITFTQSVTVNGDGTEEWTVKETYPKNTFTKAEQEVYCETAKLEAVTDDEEDGSVLKDFKCSDGEISGTWTESTDEKITVDQYKSLFEYICNPFENEMPDFMGDDDDDDDDDDNSGSVSQNTKKYFADDSRLCKFGLSDDVWITGNSKYEWTGDSSYTLTSYYDKGSAKACKDYLDIASLSFDEYECDGSLLIGKEFVTGDDRRDRLVAAQRINCDGDFELDDETSSDEISSSSSDDDDYGFDSPIDSLLSEVEKMPECTKSNEGDKTTYLGMSMICKDGEWEPDMEDLGVDLGNCDSFKKSDDVWTKTMNVMGMEVTETYKWIDATTVEYTSSMKGLEAFAETETLEDQDRDDLYEYFCEE